MRTGSEYLRTLLGASVLWSLACGRDERAPAADPVPPASPAASPGDPCDEIREATFRSVEMLGSFMKPDGAGPDRVFVRFHAGNVEYAYTDVSYGGDYDCADGAISPKGALAGPQMFDGRYDPATGILTWKGHAFERVIWNGRDFERVSRDRREPERAK